MLSSSFTLYNLSSALFQHSHFQYHVTAVLQRNKPSAALAVLGLHNATASDN